jgi:hypothetical protein
MLKQISKLESVQMLTVTQGIGGAAPGKRAAAAVKDPKKISLEDLYSSIKEGKLKELKLIIKADVRGSLEAIKTHLARKLSSPESTTRLLSVLASTTTAQTDSRGILNKIKSVKIIASGTTFSTPFSNITPFPVRASKVNTDTGVPTTGTLNSGFFRTTFDGTTKKNSILTPSVLVPVKT